MKQTLLFALALLLALGGCNSPEVASPSADAESSPVRFSSMTPHWVKPEHAADIGMRSQVGGDASMAFYEAAEALEQPDWQAMDSMVRAYREGVAPEHRYMVDQFFAREMLSLLDEQCYAGCEAARAFYVELLLTSEHPDAAALEHYVGRLEGYWPADRVAEARRQSAAAARQWLGRQQAAAAKRNCGPGEDCGAVTDAQAEATRLIAEATRRLEAR